MLPGFKFFTRCIILENRKNFNIEYIFSKYTLYQYRFAELILDNWPLYKTQNNIFSLFFKTIVFDFVKCWS